MVGFRIPDGFIDLAKTEFQCPNCKKKYSDSDDKYLKRLEKNKNGITQIRCECKTTFYMTYDMTGDAVSFLSDKK